MRAGCLDRRVTVEVRTRVQSASGEETEIWNADFTVWMGKRDIRAAERFAAQQTVAEIDTVFTARWSPVFERVFADTHRLVDGTRIYNIHGLTEIGRRNGVEIAAAARIEAGA